MLAILQWENLERIDTADFAGDLNWKWRRIERADSRNSAAGMPKTIPQHVAIVSERCEAAKATDYNAIVSRSPGVKESHVKIIRQRWLRG